MTYGTRGILRSSVASTGARSGGTRLPPRTRSCRAPHRWWLRWGALVFSLCRLGCPPGDRGGEAWSSVRLLHPAPRSGQASVVVVSVVLVMVVVVLVVIRSHGGVRGLLDDVGVEAHGTLARQLGQDLTHGLVAPQEEAVVVLPLLAQLGQHATHVLAALLRQVLGRGHELRVGEFRAALLHELLEHQIALHALLRRLVKLGLELLGGAAFLQSLEVRLEGHALLLQVGSQVLQEAALAAVH